MSENYIDISKMTEDDKQSHIDNVETAMDYNIHVSDNDFKLYMEIISERSSDVQKDNKNLTDDRKIFKRGKCLWMIIKRIRIN